MSLLSIARVEIRMLFSSGQHSGLPDGTGSVFAQELLEVSRRGGGAVLYWGICCVLRGGARLCFTLVFREPYTCSSGPLSATFP